MRGNRDVQIIKSSGVCSYLDKKKEFKRDEVWLLGKNKEFIFSCFKHNGKYQLCNLNEEEMSYMKNITQQSKNLTYEIYKEYISI